MGKIRDFLRSVSVHFGAPRQNVLKLILKSPWFFQIGANSTPDIPASYPPMASHLPTISVEYLLSLLSAGQQRRETVRSSPGETKQDLIPDCDLRAEACCCHCAGNSSSLSTTKTRRIDSIIPSHHRTDLHFTANLSIALWFLFHLQIFYISGANKKDCYYNLGE